MVFEAIVVDVLNRFIGDYVENLDRSQLKLGIWGGDVVLQNLVLKQNALEELNIPVQIVYGHLGKLVLKIPWKNLYGASVEASVERLFLIITPSAEVKYDPEKEEKILLASKQAELARIEDAKKREAQQDLNKLDETFVEKLATQIIKNVQLKIRDIHIRYEDTITNPKAPFSFGITLHNLSVHTTDENWKQCVIQEAVTKIFKILDLEGLAVYWNPATKLYSKLTAAVIKESLQTEIANKTHKPTAYNYALGPINATAKLKLNPKPENDNPKFSIPKIILTLHMEQLMVTLNKMQYQDMMMLADSMDRMNKGAPYRKYRPDLNNYRGHYKEWWHFAYKCVLEEDVKRRRRNWDWSHMQSHRQLCREYAAAYQSKLSNKGKVSSEQKNILEEGEKKLTLLNLVIIRQQIEFEVERLGKLEEEAKKSRGWFGGWWGGNTSKDDELAEGTAILKQFENAMTPEEKAKLYRAIDYQENTAPLHLPVEYIAVYGLFHLDRLQVAVYDKSQVLRAAIDNVEVGLKQRPSANALRVDIQMQKFSVLGVKQGNIEPELVISKEVSKDANLLNVVFETNPLDGLCDQRVKVQAKPLQMVYDAQTVIEIVNVFKPPTESTALETLQAAAENKLSDLKEKSSLGMQYAVNQHMFIDIDIAIASSYIIVPDKGVYKGNERCVVVKLGAISVKTAPRSKEALDIKKLVGEGLADEDILREITGHAYDKLSLELTEMQIVIAKVNEDWMSVISSQEPSYLHLLQPSNLIIQIHKCLIMDDPRLPKIKVIGELQKIAISVAEDRLLTLFEILVGIPLPTSDAPAPLKASDYKTPYSGRDIAEGIHEIQFDLRPTDSKSSNLSLFKYLDPAEKEKRENKQKKDIEQSVQLTEVEAFFVIKELLLSVNRKSDDTYHRMLVFGLTSLELTATQRTFTLETVLRLGSMKLDHHRPSFDVIQMIHTPDVASNSSDQYLFTITYLNVNKKCPDFRSHYGSVEQLIKLDFKVLSVILHQEGLKQIMLIANEYQTRLQVIQGSVDRMADAGPLPTIAEEGEVVPTKSKVTPKPSKKKQVDSIHLKVNVKIGAVEIQFATDKRPLSNVQLQGMQSAVVMKSSYMQIGCSIASINVEDLNPATIHKKILKVLGGDVINVKIVMYNLEEYPHVSDINMSIDAQVNCLRIVFLNWYVSSMLEFLNNFQAAQQAIIDASAVAADAARANVQNAYENSTKVLLRVKLDAPLIIVPENSKSLAAMLIDLGHMNINNNFVDLKVQGFSNNVTIDELTLDLENVKLSCVQLNGYDDDYTGERKLLKPTSFTLLVKRSLSSWYEPLPDLDISGRLKTIQIIVGQKDYKSIMKILNQNLQEGHHTPDPKQVQPVQSGPSRPSVKGQVSSKTQMRSPSQTQMSGSKVPANTRVTMNFTFTMDSFVIDLMSHPSNKKYEEEKDVDLARFCLALLAVKGRMLSDNSMQTSVLLVDCTLDDTRPARGDKITRYLERRPSVGNKETNAGKPSEDKSMIDITYTMKNSDSFADIRVSSFNLILAMDFLNKIIEFVTTGVGEAPPEQMSVIKSQPEKSTETLQTKSKTSVVVPTIETDQNQKSMMTVNLKIEQPDIILVESLEGKKCDSLVLNMEVTFKLRKTEERMAANGSISGLQMIIRTLGDVADTEPRYLLSPAHLNLVLSAPPDTGMHIDVEVSDIYIKVSPEIIGLLNRVLATVTKKEEDEGLDDTKAIIYDNVWELEPFNPSSYWFLKTEVGEEAIFAEGNEETPNEVPKEIPKPPSGEICITSAPNITITLEMEVGSENIPILVMQAALQAQVKEWSTEMYVESTMAMQISYYNIKRALWEPLLEPVEVLKDNEYRHVPWEMKLEVVMHPQDNSLSIDTTDEAANSKAIAQRQANTTVTISCTETLEITMSRTCMEVLTLLGNSFAAATQLEADSSTLQKSRLEPQSTTSASYSGAPYVLHNCTGLTAKIMLQDSQDFIVFRKGEDTLHDYKEVVLEAGATVPLQLKKGRHTRFILNETPKPLTINIKIVELEVDLELRVERADKRYFPLGRNKAGNTLERTSVNALAQEPRGMISEVVMKDGAMQIYLKSVVQVTNTLSVNVAVYYMTLSGNEVRLLSEVKPGGTLRLPLQAVHTPTGEIFFSVEGFTVSVSPFIWRELQQEVKSVKLLHCKSKDKSSKEKFYLKAVGTMEQVFFENTNKQTFASSCYDIVLKPAVKMQNCLPLEIVVSQSGFNRTQTFKPGEMFHLSNLEPHKATVVVMLENYLEKCWVATETLPADGAELSVWSFDSHDSPSVITMNLGMHNVDLEGTQMLSLYCPFWMLNKTGLTLSYRMRPSTCRKIFQKAVCMTNYDDTGNVIFHPPTHKDPILFSFRAKNFFGKKKAAIRIDFGEWSEKFPLDVPGSSGVVICKNEGRTYQVAVTNQLSFNSLTKMVVFTPFFLIINEAPFPIQYQELSRSGDPWQEIEASSSAPLWPLVDKDDKLLLVRVSGSTEHAAPFLYTEQHSTALRLNNQYGGLHVETQLGDGGTYITIRQYRAGHAPALLVNFTPHTVTLYENESVNVKKIPSMHRLLFTWDNPAGPRTLIFEAHKKAEFETDLRKDDIGDFLINEANRIYWVSFLDGLQRVVLFTDDPILASGAHTVGEAEMVDTEVILSMQGMGLSLVNDPEYVEIIYMSISSSGIIWEQCKIGARRYKKVDSNKMRHLETAYQRYLDAETVSDTPVSPLVQLEDKIEVDFKEMRQFKPSARLLRRILEPGIWASLGLTPHSRRIHARLHRLQIDQQLPLPTFPVVLAPVPPPRSVASGDAGMKPFMEISIVERIMEHTKVRQYKYYKMLIQEFHVKVEMGLINALMGMFPQRSLTEQEALDAFVVDLEHARQPLEMLAAQGAASDQKNFYDNLHLSPLKVHLSFSLGGATQLPTFVGTVLQSIGVTLTDMNDVIFKLGYYEKNYEFLSQKELMTQVQNHYTSQALKQLYVLVLGLDVIGNPYGLVIGLKKGVEDLFYEPFQGAIQGPGEFAEGLFIGVRSLLGHTVGGAAGAMSRITGAMGQGLAALSLDEDFQRRRRVQKNKPPANFQEGMARSGKGLVMGVVDGVTGVFTKPIEGAREDGVKGFFGGLGKGAMGLVARPTAGVVDFASGSLDAVKRAADMSEDVQKHRAARYLPQDSGLRPYSRMEAEGFKMLSDVEKGKYVSTDTYEAHVWVIPKKEVVLCTDKRLLYLEKNSIFGGWQILWGFLWTDIPEVPSAVKQGVYIPTAKKKVLGMFTSSHQGKIIILHDQQQKKFLLAQCERLIAAAAR